MRAARRAAAPDIEGLPSGCNGFHGIRKFGIASTAASGYDLRQLLAHADSALYAAKRSGRNRVAMYDTSVAVMDSARQPRTHRNRLSRR